jgi:hypothetical protein
MHLNFIVYLASFAVVPKNCLRYRLVNCGRDTHNLEKLLVRMVLSKAVGSLRKAIAKFVNFRRLVARRSVGNEAYTGHGGTYQTS